MGRSMYSAVSGLLNMQTGIDVIGNNVANVNTIGYKGNTTNFQDILSQTVQGASAPAGNLGGTNPMQVGLGMTVASIGTNFKDGNLQSTGKQTDMALSGNGFFILQNGSDTVYTRVGSFTQDALGSYVSSGGLKLMGWMADATGTITSGASMQPIQVKLGTTMASKTTTAIDVSKNLKGDAAVGYSFAGSADVFDSIGTKHTLNTNYYKAAVTTTTPTSSTWLTYSSVKDPVVTGTVANQWQTVTFDATGANPTVQSIPDASIPTGGSDTVDFNNLTLDPTLGGKSTQTFLAIQNGQPQTYQLTITADSATANKWTYTLSQVGGTASAVTGSIDYGITSPGVYSFKDSAGAAQTSIALGTAPNTFTLQNLTAGTPVAPVAGGFTVGPAKSANVTTALAAATTAAPFQVQFSNGTSQLSINRNLSALTQFGGMGDSTLFEQPDGYAAGTLQSTSLDKTGTIVGTYSNGERRNMAQVALAGFANPEGLTKVGDSNYQVSNNSGKPQIGAAKTGGLGTITGGSLEMSNVDLATEFTNMIITERGYQANSKVITTSDEMLQELNSLKR